MTSQSRPHLGVSSWSLHRTLGAPHFDGQQPTTSHEPDANGIDLLDLPRELERKRFDHVELCHFHIRSADSKYLHALRERLEGHQIKLWALLLDDGDITHPQDGPRWVEWNKAWIDAASTLGARHVRVIAGKQSPSPENLQIARERLQVLADYAGTKNVRVLTENWFDLLPGADEVLWLMAELKGAIGLKIDFNNWKAPHKYLHLPRIAHLAESAHAKCVFPNPMRPDEEDFTRCLDMMRAVDFKGQYTLIYDGADVDEWAHLAIERAIIERYL